MNVLMLAPGYPAQMPLFARALSWQGAAVFGLSDVPPHELPQMAREALAGYLQAPLLDEARTVAMVRAWRPVPRFDRVICMWEPGVILAARLREALEVEGMGVRQATLFRNKDLMKEAIAAAGIRTPRHASATTVDGVREAAERIGYPIIIKPIAGAGSMDTFRVDDAAALEGAIDRLRSYDEVNVEEFIEGEEYTYDTICHDGHIDYYNVCFYRPRPLIARSTEWISPQTMALRDLSAEELQGGIAMGEAVLEALGFRTGFTHMEWYRKPDGEVVFGEIAARPPGAHTVDLMNFVSDTDLYVGYAEAELHGRFTRDTTRRYNAVNIFKRAIGQGRIQRIEGLDGIMQRYGEHVAVVDLLPVGAPRRDWVQTLVSDGWISIRHPDLETTMAIADAVGTEVRMYAG
jgi:biotin carboxylase